MTPHDRRELNEANERLRLTLAAEGASGTWDWDIEHAIFYPDARFVALYGLDATASGEGLAPSMFFSAIHPDDRARVRIAVAGILSGAEVFSKEYRIVLRDGTIKWVHGRGRSHLDAEDRPVRFTGLLVDITEQKRTEERLRIAQTAGGIGTFEYIAGFATATVSPQFCRLLGLHPAEVLPVTTINSVVTTGEAIIPANVRPETDVLDDEISIIGAEDGEPRWIARRGEIVRDADSTGYRFTGALYDITSLKSAQEGLRLLNETLESRVQQEIAEREQAEEALRQAQKMEAIGQLTGGIAHDFNNLLTIIIGNIDTLGRRLVDRSDPRTVRALDNALKGAERAAALTQRLLAFSRRQPLHPRTVDIEQLLGGVTDLLRRSLGEAVLIEMRVASDVWRVEVDQNQLENALLNLAVNARDAMDGIGQLRIVAQNVQYSAAGEGPVRPYVMIAVSDTGSGMSPETVARAFDPFFTTKEVGKG
ncbi:MAG: hybrid sensor histidine kinase/response regulator, partial [Rhizorhabdus sp.]|nr:hybrid sensor histidine kinase/response regulator [Rhizorhabdus sp.]